MSKGSLLLWMAALTLIVATPHQSWAERSFEWAPAQPEEVGLSSERLRRLSDGPVFQHPGHCWRSGITYNTALKRYIWFHVYPKQTRGDGAPAAGGCGVYDAPEPWGPWTTVFHTEQWDMDPGESGCFPTKWMARTGESMWLVFSGEDSFSVRRVDIILHKSDDGPR
ncbi:MAG: hypothetical protein KatS3mg112_1924 [Thermogutta sp.]|nr:MAG: hypothetical protein KatS3mg112_1924 [Thermogutta sp.]